MIEPIKWEKTSDNLPDDNILVLFIADDGEASTGIVTAGQWFDTLYGDLSYGVVAPEFWAPMPVGPVVLQNDKEAI